MEDDADQLARGVARQARVAVERDAVADLWQNRDITDVDDETGVGGPAQQAVELLDLAPLALPPHPASFRRVPLPPAVKQEEPVVAVGRMPGVEGVDREASSLDDGGVLRHRFAVRVAHVAEDGEVHMRIEVAERLHLEMRDEFMRALDAVENGRHDHHRASRCRHVVEVESRKAPGRNEGSDDPLQDLNREFAGRHDREQRQHQEPCGARPLEVRVDQRGRDQQHRPGRDGPEIPGCPIPEEPAARTLAEARRPLEVDLELPAPSSDQVVPDVRGACLRRLVGREPGSLHRPQRDAHLALARGFRQFLDRIAIAVAAREVHPPEHAGRVTLQHLLDEAHALEELTPVERRDEPKAADEARHRRLLTRLVTSVGLYGVLDRTFAARKHPLETLPQAPGGGTVFTRSLKQADHEGRMRGRGPRYGRRGQSFGRVNQLVGTHALQTARRQRLGPLAELRDQRQLEQRGPRPEFADGQRRDGLEGCDIALQALRIQATAAASDEFAGHDGNAGLTRELPRGRARQTPIVGRRQIVADVEGRRRDDVEVVEHPLRGGRHRLAPTRVVGQRGVHVAKDAHVVAEPSEVVRPVSALPGRHGQKGREAARVLFELLDGARLHL